uniref:DDE Tnp4 domain-containing protein n=1 Tax=Amblyomma maculatum TaxID=34609 RepID=G3MT55_AMBMU
MWVQPAFLERKQKSLYFTLMREVRDGKLSNFTKHYRMTPRLFDVLLSFVEDDLTRQHVVREPLEPGERLAITLSYLASGKDIREVANMYLVGIETARISIHLTCRAIWTNLRHRFMKVPTGEDWCQIAEAFAEQWQFPNCVGAIGGRHVTIATPSRSSGGYLNHKNTSSVVLLAAVDSSCRYILVDVCTESRPLGSNIFEDSELGKAICSGALGVPTAASLPNTGGTLAPYVFVGDDTFSPRKHLVSPFPGEQVEDENAVFNYRLNRAQRCAENALGLTAARWRVLLRTVHLKPCNIDYVIKATCMLHNFLIDMNTQQFADVEDGAGNLTPGLWRKYIKQTDLEAHYFPLEVAAGVEDCSAEAAHARNLFMAYFCSGMGEVPWQWQQAGVSSEDELGRATTSPTSLVKGDSFLIGSCGTKYQPS